MHRNAVEQFVNNPEMTFNAFALHGHLSRFATLAAILLAASGVVIVGHVLFFRSPNTSRYTSRFPRGIARVAWLLPIVVAVVGFIYGIRSQAREPWALVKKPIHRTEVGPLAVEPSTQVAERRQTPPRAPQVVLDKRDQLAKSGAKLVAAAKRGSEAFERAEYDQAAVAWDEAIRLAPNHSEIHRWRGDASLNLHEFDRALSEYEKAIQLDPKNAMAYVSRGMAWTEKGEPDKAIAAFQRAIELKPEVANTPHYQRYVAAAESLRSTAQNPKLPDWATHPVDESQMRKLVVVSSGFAATPQEAEQAGVAAAVDLLADDFRSEVSRSRHEDAGKWKPPAAVVRSQAIRRTHVERIDRKTISSGTPFQVYRAYCQVELSPAMRNVLFPYWKTEIVDRRLAMLGGLAALLTFSFGTLATYFRLDDRTVGQYRGRLKFAAASLIAAGGVAATRLLL